MEKKQFDKITASGRVHLGHRRELVQRPSSNPLPRPESGVTFMSTARGPEHKQDPVDASHLSGIGSILDFSLEPTSDELYIKDAGLTTSFGIFGAPGSGKTVLLNHLLYQVLSLYPDAPEQRFGALILDPKAGLVDDVQRMVAACGRQKDLRIIGMGDEVNLIDCALDSQELGSILVLAGLSAGNAVSDPFWFQEWTNVFAAALGVLRLEAWLNPPLDGECAVTLAALLDAVFKRIGDQRLIQVKAAQLARLEKEIEREHGAHVVRDLTIDMETLNRFFGQDYTGTVEALITKSYGMFRRSRLANYSAGAPTVGKRVPFYEDIVKSGRIVLVSVPPSEPVLAKTVCTVVKCLFQRTVLARGVSELLRETVRPVVLACDEYSEIASEVPGQSMGDGQFLALARQYGCMALLATQSVNVLEASSLRETWKSVYSNFAAKIYMRAADNETAQGATSLAGESDWRVITRSRNVSEGGQSAGQQKDLRSRQNVPPAILTQRLRTGEAVAIGALDGGSALPGTWFLKVPYPLAYKAEEPKVRTSADAGAPRVQAGRRPS